MRSSKASTFQRSWWLSILSAAQSGRVPVKLYSVRLVFHNGPNIAANSNTNYYSSVVMPSEHLSDIDSSYMKALESRLQCIADGGAEEPTPIKDILFTVQEILTMRGATPPREMEAQYWFYGTFLKCIAGKRAWGSNKFHTAITWNLGDWCLAQWLTLSTSVVRMWGRIPLGKFLAAELNIQYPVKSFAPYLGGRRGRVPSDSLRKFLQKLNLYNLFNIFL